LSYSVKFEDIGLKDYKEAWDYQADIFKELIKAKMAGGNMPPAGTINIPGTLIFVEHPHVYTLGKSGSEKNLLLNLIQLRARDAKFYRIDRGGDITYHGPGQIVGYPIFDLEVIKIGLKEYIFRLEAAVIETMREYGLTGSRISGGTGVWIDHEIKGRVRKICAIGVKASKYVTMHGFAFNICTDNTWFNHINPCGFTDKGVTSLEQELGRKPEMNEVKNILRGKLRDQFDLVWINEKN
jgi:lipoyl(octanoyl) transferase